MMKLDIRSLLLLLATAAVLPGCPKKQTTDATPEAAASASAEGTDEEEKGDQDDKDADKDEDEAKDKEGGDKGGW